MGPIRDLQYCCPHQLTAEMLEGGVGPGFPPGLVENEPMLFAFKAKREAALGEKPVESSGEVSGGLVVSR